MALACPRRPLPLAPLLPLQLPLPLPAPLQPFRSAISGVVIGVTAAAAGLLLGSLSNGSDTNCEVCMGTGYVPCFCSRYSASSGPRLCGECDGSSQVRCPRCRGGGTPVPTMSRVPIPVRISDGTFNRFASILTTIQRFVNAPTNRLRFSTRQVLIAR